MFKSIFKEKYLVSLDKGEALKTLLNPLGGSADRAGNVLNANSKAVPFNTGRVERANSEVQNPIMSTVKSIRSALSSALLDLPKAVVTKTLGTASDIVTSAVALPANIGRWALDLVRFVPRTVLIATDTLAEQTFGRISKIAKDVNEKVHGALGTTPALA